jgi:hypothetical protein
MKARWLRLGMNLWPPFRGAGIRVRHIADDYRNVTVELSLGRLNRNYIGTHFGGSLYAMTDPFYMLMLMHILGRDFAVAHAGARIEFLAPARGTVHAHFSLGEDEINTVRTEAAAAGKLLPEFSVDVVGAGGAVVARVTHVLHVRHKTARP